MKNNFFNRTICLLVCLAILLSTLPGIIFSADAAEPSTNLIVTEKLTDPSTATTWEDLFGPDKMDTEYAGGIWTDKSVYTENTDKLPGVALDNSNNFLVALSAIASNLAITGYTSSPTDTMLVLDVSGSMVDGTFTAGYERSFWGYNSVTAIDMSLIEAMVEATNDTIDRLMKQNSNNRIGVVLYSGNTSTDQAATPSSAIVILPLGRYTGVNGEYLEIDADYVTDTLYQRTGNNSYSRGPSVTYVPNGENVSIRVRSGVTGNNVPSTSKQVVGGTYIQNGLYQAMKQFLAVTDTIVPAGSPQAGAERQPVIVLMSDGAPTICTNDYSGTDGTDANIGNSNYGTGSGSQEANTLNRIAVMTQLTAAYVRGKVAAHYQESATDSKDITFLTLGLGTSANATATATLYPAGSSNSIKNIWNTYLAAADGQDVQLSGSSFSGTASVRRHSEVEALNYVDKYFYAASAQDLIDSFDQIVTEIELKAESYSTLVEGDSADLSGYVTFEDELGEMMYVADMKGILMSNGNGGIVLYTGKGIAQGMTNGNLGSIENPTARGDELVRTVRERIPGLDTSMAQRLIGSAYDDQQLYFADDNNWSNYIGWYADANGNYVGFWDKDSGYENAPANAVYANRSYGYLGVQGDTDMMHVVVQVRTELKTLHQTVYFKIPASLLPTVQYRITVSEDNPAVVDEFIREDALPMQLVFEVGLRPDINSVNLNAKIEEHLARGGHVHRNQDGTVTFYTNEWAIGNDTNGNGIPDPEEVETAKVAKSHFHPAMDNNRYYYTEDTLILDASGNPVGGAIRPSGSYFHTHEIYNETRQITVTEPVSAYTLENYAQYDSVKDQWYIPAGTIFRDFGLFKVDKGDNTTGTLSYSEFPAVFENGDKQDVYTFLGNNGAITIAPAQGIALTKTVSEPSTDPNAPTTFLFKVTLDQAVANPVITDTDGNLLDGISSVSGNVITVKLAAGETVVITGIPTGTTYTVEEEATAYYRAFSTNATGTVTVHTIHDVDFINTSKHYGSLVVGKDVNYPEGFAPGTAHNNKTFTVHVTFTGDTENMVVPQGAVANGNTYTLQLKDGYSATFRNIPEGVTYTVTEDNLPAGYAMQEIRYTDTNHTIDGNDVDAVTVVNQYSQNPVSANLQIKGTKTVTGGWPDGAAFTIRLWKVYDFASGEIIKTDRTATVTASNASYIIDISDIPFDRVGTYYIRVAEDIPEGTDRIPDMAYDRTMGLFSITVTDDDADGTLEIKDGAVVGYQGTPVTGNAAEGWVVTKDFTNVVTKDLVYLDIEKNLTGFTGNNPPLADITFGLFSSMTGTNPQYYDLTDGTGKATIMVPVTKDVIDSNGGELVYYLREIAPAAENRVVGMHYNESWLYAIRITWDDVNNQAVTEYAPINNGVVGTYAPYDRENVTFTHTNTYEENVKVEVELSGNKTLNGNSELGGRVFSFSLYESTAAFRKGDLIETVENVGNSLEFGALSFTAPGIYYMVAEENASTLGGITIDPTVYHITVAVEKFIDTDGTTRLRLVEGYPIVMAFGTSTDVGVDGLNFNNLYTVTGSDEVVIQGTKMLTGKILNAYEFRIGLYSDAQCETLIESVTNQANGSFSFTKRIYTANDIGKTETFYVKEINDGKAGITYDPTVHTVTVEVKDLGNGTLDAVVTVNGTVLSEDTDNVVTLTIENTYTALPVDTTVNGSKSLAGDWSAVTDQTFTFDLFKADASFDITDETPVKFATVTGQGSFSMELHFEDGQEGVYYYVLEERFTDHANGVVYDAGEYHITVNVSDPGNGQLVATVTMYRPGVGNTTIAGFTNRYSVEPTTLTLEGSKQYTHSATGEPITQEEGEFTFSVLDGEAVISTGKNLTDGTIQFAPITYTQAGTYVYTVIENAGNAGGILYDDTEFTVTVTVVDNGDGTLSATADYGTTPIVFENAYAHESAQVSFNGEKVLTGDWSTVSQSDKTFLFEMYATGELYTIDGEPVDTVQSGEGSFTFGTHTFAEAGTYYFVIRELAEDLEGVDYDETIYRIAVTVTDDGEGHLIPTVSTADPTVTVTADSSDNSLLTVSDLVFTNNYEADPVPSEPGPPKTGDYFNIPLWVALLFISGGAIAALTVVNKKKLFAGK